MAAIVAESRAIRTFVLPGFTFVDDFIDARCAPRKRKRSKVLSNDIYIAEAANQSQECE
jgi:hypothetical protein